MKESKKDTLIEEIALYILTSEDMQLKQMTRSSIADEFRINESQLSTDFKAVTGKCLSEFMDCEKMFRARNTILEKRAMTIESVSSYIGIAKVNHFRKKFRRVFNVPPGRYKNKVIHSNIQQEVI